jgi:hypothetical protein
MGEMTVAVAIAAVATSVCLVGEVRGTGSRRVNSDGCAGKAEELKKKDFAYVHVELPDEVVYGSDVTAKVKGIEAVDLELIDVNSHMEPIDIPKDDQRLPRRSTDKLPGPDVDLQHLAGHERPHGEPIDVDLRFGEVGLRLENGSPRHIAVVIPRPRFTEGKLRLDADITKVARWLGRAAAQGNAGAAAALRAFAAAHVPAAVALVRCLRHEARGGGARRLYAQRTHR